MDAATQFAWQVALSDGEECFHTSRHYPHLLARMRKTTTSQRWSDHGVTARMLEIAHILPTKLSLEDLDETKHPYLCQNVRVADVREWKDSYCSANLRTIHVYGYGGTQWNLPANISHMHIHAPQFFVHHRFLTWEHVTTLWVWMTEYGMTFSMTQFPNLKRLIVGERTYVSVHQWEVNPDVEVMGEGMVSKQYHDGQVRWYDGGRAKRILILQAGMAGLRYG